VDSNGDLAMKKLFVIWLCVTAVTGFAGERSKKKATKGKSKECAVVLSAKNKKLMEHKAQQIEKKLDEMVREQVDLMFRLSQLNPIIEKLNDELELIDEDIG